MAETKPDTNKAEQRRCSHGVLGAPRVHEESVTKFGGDWKIDFFNCVPCLETCLGFPHIPYKIGA